MPSHRQTPTYLFKKKIYKNETESSYTKKTNELCDKVLTLLQQKQSISNSKKKLIASHERTKPVNNGHLKSDKIISKITKKMDQKTNIIAHQIALLIENFLLNIACHFDSTAPRTTNHPYCLNTFFSIQTRMPLKAWEASFKKTYNEPNHNTRRTEKLSALLENFPDEITLQAHLNKKTQRDNKEQPPTERPLDKSER